MSLLATIVNEANSKGLRFLVIGGHAVNAHGFSRFTKDIDLLVRREDDEAWETFLVTHGFILHRRESAFTQFHAPAACPWPLDLMLVNDATFDRMWSAAQEVDWNGLPVRMPCLDHLFALKFHALKHGPRARGYKDFLDVMSLADVNGLDVRSDRIRQLCDKYGDAPTDERLVGLASGNA